MTTVYEISLQMMRHVTDVLNGKATGGSTTTLVDTLTLKQPNEYYDGGVVWIKSGVHAGETLNVTGHNGNTLTFSAVTGALAADVRYAVARGAFPWEQIMGAIQQALDSTHITGHDYSLIGDGTTLAFSLPAGVSDIKEVRLEKPNQNGLDSISNHWEERLGSLVFDYGFAPVTSDIIHIYYRAPHEEISGYATEISAEINPRWLVLEAAKTLLIWGAGMYGKKPDFMIEERINLVMNALKGKRARLGSPSVTMKSAGGGRGY